MPENPPYNFESAQRMIEDQQHDQGIHTLQALMGDPEFVTLMNKISCAFKGHKRFHRLAAITFLFTDLLPEPIPDARQIKAIIVAHEMLRATKAHVFFPNDPEQPILNFGELLWFIATQVVAQTIDLHGQLATSNGPDHDEASSRPGE